MEARKAGLVHLGCRWVALAPFVMVAACSVSEEREVAMGKDDAAQVESEMPIVHDTVVDQFITKLGRSMASHTNRGALDWHFTVVNSPR